MFRHAWLALLFFFASLPALGAPSVTFGPGAKSGQATVIIATGDTSDSRAIPVDGVCSARVVIAGSDVVELWGVNSPATAATSGTQIGSDFTTSTAPTVPYVWKAGTTHVKVKGTTATTGGSTVIIDCQPLTSAGGGSGDLHPASGIDSEICLGENSDHGTDTYCLRIDADTDIVSQTQFVGPSGQTGTRIMSAFVDDSAHGEVRELVRWNNGVAAVSSPPNANGGLLSGGTGVADTASLLNGGMMIGSTTGGAIRATGLSIRTGFSNAGNANRCDWQVQVVETTGYQFDSTDKNDDAVTTACVGTIQMGFSSSNSGGFGDTVVGPAFSGYYLPMGGDCACATDDCFLAVSVSDRTPGSATCDAINDVYVNLFVTETPL